MNVEITNTDWFLGQQPPEGTVTFKTISGKLINAFSYAEAFIIGEKVEVDLESLNYNLEWEIIFSHNPNKEKKLQEGQVKWEYEGYGAIKSINPVIIDFGDIELETGNWTNDEKVIGAYVYWKIERLDIIKRRPNLGSQ